MGVSTIDVGGMPVILVDCSDFKANEADKIIETLREGSRLVASKPKKFVRIITIVTGLRFNSAVVTAFKEYASANTEYVKDSVIVGMDGLHMVIFSAVKAMTGRDFKLAGTMDEAKAYLLSQ
jgi:hypothetical protein